MQKATTSFIMSVLPSVTSVRLSVCMEELRSHWIDFHEIISQDLLEICQETSSFIQTWQE